MLTRLLCCVCSLGVTRPLCEWCTHAFSVQQRASATGARFVNDAKSSLGHVTRSLGDTKSSLGDAKSSLGDAPGEPCAVVHWPVRPSGRDCGS